MLIFADHTGLKTAGQQCNQCLPVAHPSPQTADGLFGHSLSRMLLTTVREYDVLQVLDAGFQ